MRRIIYSLILAIIALAPSGARAQATADNPALPDYSEHDIWSDSYPIYDAIAYKGKFYAIQNYNKEDELRLIQFEADPKQGTIRDTGHWKMEHSSQMSATAGCAVVEYQDALYIFGKLNYVTQYNGVYCYARKFHVDSEGKGYMENIPTPSFLNDDVQACIKATVYKGKLCLFYIKNKKGKVYMSYTDGNPANKDTRWETRETIAQPIYSDNNLSMDAWNVATWFGQVNGQSIERLVLGLIAGPNFHAYTFDGSPSESVPAKWATYDQNNSVQSGCFNLKMLQASAVGQGSSTIKSGDNNPLQFVYAIRDKGLVEGGIHQTQIRYREFFPGSGKFGSDTKTNLPYGFFGAAVAPLSTGPSRQENDPTLGKVIYNNYQQYIIILRGACEDNHFTGQSHYAMIKANLQEVTQCFVTTEEMLNNASLRKLCTLSTVIEGAPPVTADNAKMYSELKRDLSTLTLKKGTVHYLTETSNTNISINAGLGPDLDAFTLQALGGYEFSKSVENSKETTTEHEVTFSNHDIKSASTGYYIYTIPELIRYRSRFLSPDGSTPIAGRPELYTFREKGRGSKPISFFMNSAEIPDGIRVDEPWKLESWRDRSMEFNIYNGYTTLALDYLNIDNGGGGGLKETATSGSSQQETVTLGGNLKTPALQIAANYSFGVSKSNTVSLNKEINFHVDKVTNDEERYYERDSVIHYYNIALVLLDNPDDKFTAAYYDYLKKRRLNNGDGTEPVYLMLPQEKPCILTWSVTGIDCSPTLELPSSVETDFAEGDRVYDDGTALVIETATGNRIQVIGMGGRLEADRPTSAGSSVRVPLPSGVYAVCVLRPDGSFKRYKIARH